MGPIFLGAEVVLLEKRGVSTPEGLSIEARAMGQRRGWGSCGGAASPLCQQLAGLGSAVSSPAVSGDPKLNLAHFSRKKSGVW